MKKIKTKIEKINGYELRIYEYPDDPAKKRIWFELLNEERRPIALAMGSTKGNSYCLADYRFTQPLPAITKARITDNLFSRIEAFLRKKGIRAMHGNTNPKFANFMRKRGYAIVSEEAGFTKVSGQIPQRKPVRLKRKP